MNIKFKVRKIIRKFYNGLNNSANDDPYNNGEYSLLERILKNAPEISILIDLGGQVEAWSEQALRINSNCKIYIFEPIPEFQERMKQKFKGDDCVVLIEGVASSENGEIEIFLDTQSVYKRFSAARLGEINP